jgi:Domain of unknown function (DUF6398)
MTQPKSIPVASRPAYEAVVALTDGVCRDHLNVEWAALCRELAAGLARKRPSPLLRGEPKVWAAGILHALGVVNFLSDRTQDVSMSLPELCEAFGVKASTVGGKSKLIRDLFKMHQFDPDWTLPSKIGHNPMVWMISVDGILIDARYATPEIQEEAYRRGLIPYIPGRPQEDLD